MKPKANRVYVPILLLFAFAVVGLNTWLAFRAVNSLVQSEYWVDHTWQSVDQVERIMSSAKDAETGNRGYLITGDDSYLAPYSVATRDLPIELNHFEKLASDNPAQLARLREMRGTIDRRLDLLQQGIDLRRKGSVD